MTQASLQRICVGKKGVGEGELDEVPLAASSCNPGPLPSPPHIAVWGTSGTPGDDQKFDHFDHLLSIAITEGYGVRKSYQFFQFETMRLTVRLNCGKGWLPVKQRVGV